MHFIKKTYILSFLLLQSLCFVNDSAAQVTGLWEVEQVQVGTETMTPVAKWFEFEDGGNYRAGNGWLQNMAGTYQYDPGKGQISQTVGGQPDEYGPFLIQFPDGRMEWEREEEGQLVKVRLKRITDLPLAPWDLLVGNWSLEKVQRAEKDMSRDYFEQPPGLFFRWDRLFFVRGEVGLLTSGIWYIHPHRPELRLISQEGDDKDTLWRLEFKDANQMQWTRKVGEEEEIWVFKKN